MDIKSIEYFYKERINSKFENDINAAITNINQMEKDTFYNSWYESRFSTPSIRKKEFGLAKELILKRVLKAIESDKAKEENKLSHILSSSLHKKYEIKVEWKNSRTWGANPHGNIIGEIYATAKASGCGYDKLSTVTADLLNHQPGLMLKLCELAMIEVSGKRTYRYYYTGFSIPKFTGGVRFNCHRQILEKFGYEVTHISGDSFDVIIIKLK